MARDLTVQCCSVPKSWFIIARSRILLQALWVGAWIQIVTIRIWHKYTGGRQANPNTPKSDSSVQSMFFFNFGLWIITPRLKRTTEEPRTNTEQTTEPNPRTILWKNKPRTLRTNIEQSKTNLEQTIQPAPEPWTDLVKHNPTELINPTVGYLGLCVFVERSLLKCAWPICRTPPQFSHICW